MSNTRRPSATRTTAARENKANGKPVVFDLDAYQAEAVREPFSFGLGGKTFTLPHMSDMDWHAAIGAGGEVAVPTVHELLRAGLGEQWKDFDKITLSAGGYNELWRRWQQHSGADRGEEDASQA